MGQDKLLLADLSDEVIAAIGDSTDAESIWEIPIDEVTETEDNITGADVVTNGSFDTDTDWTKGTGWTIADGKSTKAAGTASDIEQANSEIEVGERYYVTVRLSGVTAGTVSPYVGNTGTGTARSTDGTYSETIVAAGTLVQGLSADSSFAGSCEIISIRPIETVALTDKLLSAITRENGYRYSEDLSNAAWTKTGLFGISGTRDIIGSSVAGSQRVIQSFQGVAGDNTIRVKIEKGVADWVRFLIDSMVCFVDLSSVAVGTSNMDSVAVYDRGEYLMIEMLNTLTAGSKTFAMYLADDDNDYLTYTGNDSAIDVSMFEMHHYSGKPVDPVTYQRTTDTAYARTFKFETAIDRSAKHRDGFVQRADALSDADGWMYATEVNGIAMMEDAGNVAVLRAAGKIKRVSDDTWGDVVDGVECYSPNWGSDYCMRVNFASAVATWTPWPGVTQGTQMPISTDLRFISNVDTNIYSMDAYQNPTATFHVRNNVTSGLMEYYHNQAIGIIGWIYWI